MVAGVESRTHSAFPHKVMSLTSLPRLIPAKIILN